MREDREKKEAQAAVDRAAPAVRAAIAELEAPWELHRSGLEVIRPPEGDPFTPYRVCLERFDGNERKVVAYPKARSEGEAIRLAEAQCQAERAIYREEGRKLVEKVLKEHCAWNAHNLLRELKAAEQRAREEARVANLQPVAVSLGRMPAGPLPNWTDEGKRAAVAPRSGDSFASFPGRQRSRRSASSTPTPRMLRSWPNGSAPGPISSRVK